MKRKKLAILIELLLLSISGCVLEDGVLVKFMDEDGHYYYCPPLNAGDEISNDDFTAIRYTLNSDDDSGEGTKNSMLSKTMFFIGETPASTMGG